MDFEELTAEEKKNLFKLFEEWFPSYFSEYNFPIEVITNRLIKSITFDKAQGGTLTLGGASDTNGTLIVKDSTSNTRITINNNGLYASDGTYNLIYLSTDGVLKVARAGYDADTAAGVNLAFDSAKSTIREVQMQTNSEQRFTDQSTYQAYNDCQIQVDFSDWVDHSMFFECVMKTGAGTGYMKLYNLTDTADLSGSEISTTSTSTVSVRSSAITKLTGVKDFREEQKITGGGAAFTDVYIGRVIMRFVY